MSCIISRLKKFCFPIVVLLLAVLILPSCENHRYDSDKRQIMAKDAIRRQLQKVRGYNVTGFSEDTLKNMADSNFKTQIRYTLDITFQDSNNIFQQKKGTVLFTPNGESIISTEISDR